MRRFTSLAILLMLSLSSMVGVIGLASQPPSASSTGKMLVQPFQFEVNGKEPYVIKIPLHGGESVSGDVRTNGGRVSFIIKLGYSEVFSKQSIDQYRFRFTASADGVYDFILTSDGPVLVTFDAHT